MKKYPEITFASTEVTRFDRDRIKIRGDLALHGETRPVTILATLGGTAVDVDGNERITFNATMDIQRREFGLTFNRVIGAATKLVGEVVQIVLNIEGVEQAPNSD